MSRYAASMSAQMIQALEDRAAVLEEEAAAMPMAGVHYGSVEHFRWQFVRRLAAEYRALAAGAQHLPVEAPHWE